MAGDRDEDRVAFSCRDGGLVAVLADGAGGIGGGALAAQTACDLVVAEQGATPDWRAVLTTLDGRLARSTAQGQAAVVVVEVRGARVRGASVGDCAAWLITRSGFDDLTEGQSRKPLVGSGAACAASFGPTPLIGRLLLASDGLTKYVPAEVILRVVRESPLDEVPSALIETARLPRGGFHDDVAVLVCEDGG